MDESPRSTKRRKLDAPKRTESVPLRKPSSRKASTKQAKTQNGDTDDGVSSSVDEKPARARKGRVLKSATNGTAAKSTAAENVDVYDDFEGAFDMEIPSRATRQPTQAAPKEAPAIVEQTADVPQPAPPPKRKRGRPTKAEVAARNAAANGNSTNVVTPAPPQPRTKTARKPTAPRSNASRKKKEPSPIPEEDEGEDELRDLNSAKTPAKLPPARKAATSTRKRVPKISGADGTTAPATAPKRRKPISEEISTATSEDDIGKVSPTRNRRLPIGTTRRLNRTTHIANNDEERWSNAEDQDNTQDDEDVDGNSALSCPLLGVFLAPPSRIPRSWTVSWSGSNIKHALHMAWNAVNVVASLRCT